MDRKNKINSPLSDLLEEWREKKMINDIKENITKETDRKLRDCRENLDDLIESRSSETDRVIERLEKRISRLESLKIEIVYA